MDKDEKEFEAERDEREKNRIFGFEYIKALNKSRHEMQKSKKFSGMVREWFLREPREGGVRGWF